MPTESHGCKLYFVSFLDDYMCYVHVEFLHTKDKVFDAFCWFLVGESTAYTPIRVVSMLVQHSSGTWLTVALNTSPLLPTHWSSMV
jgi:hypothetical protein